MKTSSKQPSEKSKLNAPFLEEFMKQFEEEKRKKTSSNKSNTKDFLTMLLKQQEKISKKEEEEAKKLEKEKELTKIETLEKKQKNLEKLRKKALPNANFTPFVFNTLQFFEDNLEYFAKHTIEFQRLVAQLRTKEEQQIFLHTVFMYYYVDVLLAKRKNNEEPEEKINQRYGMSSTDELYLRYMQSQQQNSLNNQTTKSSVDLNMPVNQKLIATTLKKFEQGFKDSEELYDLVNKLNSKESLIVDSCLESLKVFDK